MRRAVLIFVLLLLAPLVQAQKRSNLIASDKPFGLEATIELREDSERGIINGVRYEFYYTDGSGKFAGTVGNKLDILSEDRESNWYVACNKDPINDLKSCYMKRGDFWVWVFDKDMFRVTIGHGHYPGSDVTIRIDKDAPLSTNARLLDGSFSPAVSAQIITRIAKAKTVTTRFQEWPSGYPTATWEVYGFNEALSYIKWAIARIK